MRPGATSLRVTGSLFNDRSWWSIADISYPLRYLPPLGGLPSLRRPSCFRGSNLLPKVLQLNETFGELPARGRRASAFCWFPLSHQSRGLHLLAHMRILGF